MKKFFLTILIFSALAAFSSSFAVDFKKSDEIIISGLHQIEDDFYGLADRIMIEGEIEGDLTVLADNIILDGEILGSVNAVFGRYVQNGTVKNSLRLIGREVEIGGEIGRSLLFLGKRINLARSSTVTRDLLIFADKAIISCNLGRDLSFKGDEISLSGTIEGNVDIKAEKIKFVPPLNIIGNLTYSSAEEIDFDSIKGVVVEGETIWSPWESEIDERNSELQTDIIITLAGSVASFLFGVLLLFFFREKLSESVNILRSRFVVTLASGVVSFIALFIVATIFLISLATMGIGFILISSDNGIVGSLLLILSTLVVPISGFLSVCGAIIFYTGKITVAFLIGYFIVRIFKKQPVKLGKFQLFIGLLFLGLFFVANSPPSAGLVIYLLVSSIGAGALVLTFNKSQK